jgi:hypothetical protein|tara:strand:- start:180 stop:578 length:399 start_codon:yes stop_codon:yes gene_type:complete
MGTKVEVYDTKKLKKKEGTKLHEAKDKDIAKITTKENIWQKGDKAQRIIDFTGKGKSGEVAQVGKSSAHMVVEPEWYEQRQAGKWKSQKAKLANQKMLPKKVKKKKTKAKGGIIKKYSAGGAATRGYGKARR